MRRHQEENKAESESGVKCVSKSRQAKYSESGMSAKSWPNRRKKTMAGEASGRKYKATKISARKNSKKRKNGREKVKAKTVANMGGMAKPSVMKSGVKAKNRNKLAKCNRKASKKKMGCNNRNIIMWLAIMAIISEAWLSGWRNQSAMYQRKMANQWRGINGESYRLMSK